MVPPRSQPGSSELTAHELQVALMVAEGRTNREVAAALFLAPKTIEHHLSTIFRKLGLGAAEDDHRRVLAVLAYLRG